MKWALIVSVVLAVIMIISCLPTGPDTYADDSALPSSYDQRDLGIVTPPKFQNPWGTCWAFGGTGATETAILSAMGKTYEETKLDLSERHLAYFSVTPVYEPITYTQEGEGLYLKSTDTNAPFEIGGWAYYYAQLMSTGVGPVLEEWYPYHGKDSESMSQFYQDHDRADAYVRAEFEDLELLLDLITEEEREEMFNEWVEKGYEFPPGVNAENYTFDDFVEARIGYELEIYQQQDVYSKFDDWTLDIAERNYTMGYSMVDGNRLRDTTIIEDGKWTGVNWDAVDDIKSELMKGHGVVTAFNSNDHSYKEEYGTFYSYTMSANHMVQVIGWDDSISKDKFAYTAGGLLHTPEGDGAWLCKDSAGSQTYGYEVNGKMYYHDWGIKDEQGRGTGYFWLSYYDRSTKGFESLTFSDELFDESGYMYHIHDFLPDLYNYHWETSTVSRMANVFEGYQLSDVDGISIYTRGYDSDITVKVYLDPEDGDPASGKLVYRTTRHYDYAGLHLIFPETKITVSEGQKFSVVFEERSPEDGYIYGLNSYLNKEEGYPSGIYGKTVINRGESYLYRDGSWSDLVDVVDDLNAEYPKVVMDNFSIKVFTVDHREDDSYPWFEVIMIGIAAACALSLVFMFFRKH